MRRFCLLIGLILFGLIGKGDVLWWGVVDESTDWPVGVTTVGGVSLRTFVESQGTYTEYDEDTGETWTGYNLNARVVAIANNSTYVLPIVYPDIPGEEFDTAEFFEGGGQQGAGLGTGWWTGQSPMNLENELLNEATFQVELGLLDWDDVTDTANWITLAASDEVLTRQQLNERGYVFYGGVGTPADHQWIPFSFHPVVPEPSTSLLLLIGASLLTLKRKRK